jgi:PAS domain S-box-containing protein
MKKPFQSISKPTYDQLKRENLQLKKAVTKLKDIEVRLIEKETHLRTVIESLPFDVFAIDKNGRYSMQNSTCKEQWGDIVGKRPKDIEVDKDTLALWEDNNRRAFSGETVEDEVVLRPHGKEKFYYNVISPIRDGDRISGILGVNIDVSERKQTEAALRESEEKFRSVTEQSPSMIYINKKGKVVYCNRKCEELMGYSHEEFCSLDFDFFDLISEESKKIVKSAFAKHMKDQEVEPYEYRLVTKGGDKLDAIITTKLIRYKGEKAILGIVTDITRRKKAEEALRESEAKFRALAESAPAAIIIIAGEGLLYVNPAFESISGFTREEAKGMRFWDFVHPDMQKLAKERGMARQRGEAAPNHYELKALTKDGQAKWLDLAAVSINYNGQNATLATAYDITESKQAKDALLAREQELEDKAQDLEEMNAALRVLLKKRDEDKAGLEEKIQYNVNQLIEPYLADLKKTQLSSRQATLLGIIKTNFDEILSPFANKLATQYKKLTPKEIQIADLIKQGKTTKEIGNLLSLSPQTVESHRKHIRLKLGIKKDRANLRTHLLSLT